MRNNQVAIATITLSRDQSEEDLLRGSMQILSSLQLPIYVTDGGSSESFVNFLGSLPNVTVVLPQGKGLWLQVNSSLTAAAASGVPFIVYTEPDKKYFFTRYLSDFIQQAPYNEQTGVVLAARSPQGFATFPAFQQHCETTINFCCAEITGKSVDYTYGPFIVNSGMVAELQQLTAGIDWGWRPYAFCMAHKLGYAVEVLVNDHECPHDQRNDNARERIYRMKQLHQNIEGVVLAATRQL